MRCARCSAELPGQAQFCLKCGTPVASVPAGGVVTMARPVTATRAHAPARPGSRTGRNMAIAAGLLLAGFAAALVPLAALLFRRFDVARERPA